MDNLNTIYKYCLDKYLNCDILIQKYSRKGKVNYEETIAFPSRVRGAASSGLQAEGYLIRHMKWWITGLWTDPEDFF